MRILWFTGVQLPAVTGKELNRAGWQEGLRRALNTFQPEIELCIASFGPEDYEPFSEDNATYYNIYREPPPGSRWNRLIKNWQHNTFNEAELDRCLEIVELVQPELIYIFGTENPFGLITDKVLVPVGISIQAVLHGLVKNLFIGLSAWEFMQVIVSRDFLTGTGLFHRFWTIKKYLPIEREIYQRNTYFCGRSDWDKTWLTNLNEDAMYFHIDRILGNQFYDAVWAINSSEANTIFSLSSNAPFKGGLTIVRALNKLNNLGHKNIHLRLGGISQDSSVGKFILVLIDKYGLQDQIYLLGRLSPQEIIREMLNARIFVLPSHMDNSPNSLAQAMIVGMPCIASNAGGIPSMLDDTVEGLIYDHKDVNALSQNILELIKDPDLCTKFGLNARKKALGRHDQEQIASKIWKVYQQLLDNNKPYQTIKI